MKPAPSAPLPTVVVPVYNALEDLDACLASLDQTLPPNARVLVADDASTDPRVAVLLAGWLARTPLQARVVTRSANLGFPANCNAAFAETSDQDVVLLNSDAIATPGWLQQLARCAASDARIASISPWSNNAEICSFPRFCEDNPAPDNPAAVAEAAASMGAPEYPELPTTVGFCLYLRRAALRQLGGFDAQTFGSGYGEENDWCLRAAAMGWRNVLCDSAYVLHRGGASFAPLGLAPNGENLARLLARWPDYNERVARFIMADPLAPLRQRLAERLQALAAAGPQRDLFGYDSPMSEPLLPFTGERYTPECVREIAYEHWHRYAFARPLARGRRVLDVACGEGYGSALLARSGAQVLGVDVDADAVAHARARYSDAVGLQFDCADATALDALPDSSFDLIVSFETLEHVHEQERLLDGFARLLAPDGVLLVSTPDKRTYTDLTGEVNPHHVRELYRPEFEALLDARFPARRLFGQKLLFQSALWALDAPSGAAQVLTLSDAGVVETMAYAPLYFLAACAREAATLAQLPSLSLFGDAAESVYADYRDEVRRNRAAASHIAHLQAELDRLRGGA